MSLCLSFSSNTLLHVGLLGTDTMEGRMGLLFLILLGATWICDARELANHGGKLLADTFLILFAFSLS